MGFFFEEQVVEKPRPGRSSASKAPRDIDSLPRGCNSCSLQQNWSWIKSPQMAVSGNTKDPDVLALGEAPGEEEDKSGAAFIGDSGRMLRRVIPGRDIDRVVFQNTVRCHPRDNATPSARDMHACSIHLEEDIARLPIKAILGVGSSPLARFYPGQAITRIHGTRFPVQIGEKAYWYFPVLHPSFVMRSGGRGRGAETTPQYFNLRADVKRFFDEVDSWPAPRVYTPAREDVLLPHTIEEALEILDAMEGPLGIDIETHRLRPYLAEAKILTAAISSGDLTMSFSVEHPEAPTSWGLELLLYIAMTRRWIAHNAAFELSWLLFMARREGMDDWQPAPYEDSMALGRLYHERETILSLEMMSRIHLGVDFKSVVRVNRANMINESLADTLPYNGLDARASRLLFDLLRKHVNTDNYDRIIGSIHSTTHMELMGLPADLTVNAALKKSWSAKRQAAAQAASTIYEVRQFEAERQIEFNIASNDHVGIALVEYGRVDLPKTSRKGDDGQRVEGAQYSTDDQVLNNLAPDNPLVKAVLSFRESNKQETTYIDSVLRHVTDAIDGLLHPSYSTMLTATTRLSSQDPNVQNFPKRRHRELREQVVAAPKHVLVSFDYGQLEARIYACLTLDKALIASIIAKKDIHGKWRDRALELYPPYIDRLAEKTNETALPAILKGGRDIIKSDFVFASFFGSSAGACADRTGMPLPITEQLLREFWGEYKEAALWVKNQRRRYEDTGCVETRCGVIRRGILLGNEPINTPIQGTAAHVVAESRNALSYRSVKEADPYLHPRIDIHDDLTFMLPDDDRLLAYIDTIAAELTKVRFSWQIVPWLVEAKLGYDWANFEFVADFIGEYNR